MVVVRADVRGALMPVRTIADVVLCILGGAALGVVVAMLLDGDLVVTT